MECKVDKIKMFLRPCDFAKVAHFFGYGYPEFDPNSEESPNAYESDFEKLPVWKMKLEVLDSMLCVDNFDPRDVVESKVNVRASGIGLDTSELIGEGMPAARVTELARASQAQSARRTLLGASTRTSGHPNLEESSSQAKTQATFTTIVCKT